MSQHRSVLRLALLGGALAAAAALSASSLAPAGAVADGQAASARTSGGAPVLLAAGDIACDPSDDRATPGSCQFRSVAKLVARRIAAGDDWFVPLGDLQYDYGRYRAFRGVYGRYFGTLRSVTMPVPGNHEYASGGHGYFRYWGKRAGTPTKSWRSFVPAPGWRVVLLNSDCPSVGGCGPASPQGRWLRKRLASSTQPCTIAAWHHPLMSSGAYAKDATTHAWARPLWRMANAGGVDIVLNGHDHIYERFAKRSAMQEFVVGTGGRSHYSVTSVNPRSRFRDANDFGVLRLVLRPDATYSWSFRTTAGAIRDAGSGKCTNQPS